MRTLFRSERDLAADAAACRVCGHRTQPIIRRTMNLALVLVIGALLGYIALDIVQDGRRWQHLPRDYRHREALRPLSGRALRAGRACTVPAATSRMAAVVTRRR